MKEALSLNSEDIKQTINQSFNLDLLELSFVPIGESSWLYKATDQEKQKYAIKIQSTPNAAVDETRKQLATAGYLFTPRLYLSTDGNVQTNVGAFHVSVEAFIEHGGDKAHDSTPSDDYLHHVGKALRELHRIPSSTNTSRPVETFHSVYLEPAKTALADFAIWSATKPNAHTINNLLGQKSEALAAMFARSLHLSDQLVAKERPLVLTHGDVHFGNTIESNNGNFYLIDWDHTMFARPGHDLMYFSDDQLQTISESYGEDLLENNLELAYYRNHLMLRFIWFYLNKAMSNEATIPEVTDAVAETLNDSPYLLRALGQKPQN